MELIHDKQTARWPRRASSTAIRLLAGVALLGGLLVAFLWLKDRPDTLRATPMAAATAVRAFQIPPVTLTGRDLQVREVLQSVASQIGARLELGAGIQGRLALDVRQTDFREVMDNLCTAFHCQWRLDSAPRRTLVVTRRTNS